MKYVVEKENTMPLCAVKDNLYINYLNGQVIDNENTLKFILEGLKRKILKIVDMNFEIYVVEEYIMPTYDRRLIAYNYQINGCNNYLGINKQLLDSASRRYIIDGLIDGKYIQEKIWGDENC